MTYRKTVAGVVYQDKEFLLVQKPHWNQWWDFPQGGVNERESLEGALLRELREELGSIEFGTPLYTEVTQRRLFSPETVKHYVQKSGIIGKDLYYFAVPFTGNREHIFLGDDLSAQRWCQESELLQLVYQEEKVPMQKVLEFMKEKKLI